MYDKLLEKDKNNVLQILKIRKASSHFDFNLTITKKTHLVMQLFGNKVIERFALASPTDYPN